MSKPGRNDPCPCGSGKKYKHCCLLKPKSNAVDTGVYGSGDPAWTSDAWVPDELPLGLDPWLEMDDDAPPATPLEAAYNIALEGWTQLDGERIEVAKEALALSPDCIEAYLLWASAVQTPEEALDLYDHALAAAERDLGPDWLERYPDWQWTHPQAVQSAHEARRDRGRALIEVGRTEEGIELLRQAVRANPEDPDSARFDLLRELLDRGREQETIDLLNELPYEFGSAGLYIRALLKFRERGDTFWPRRALVSALAYDPATAAILAGAEQDPDLLNPATLLAIGTDAEGTAELLKPFWERTPGALDWLERIFAAGPDAQVDALPRGDGPALSLALSDAEGYVRCPRCHRKTKLHKREVVFLIEPDHVDGEQMTCRTCDDCNILCLLSRDVVKVAESRAKQLGLNLIERDYVTIGIIDPAFYQRQFGSPEERSAAMGDYLRGWSDEIRPQSELDLQLPDELAELDDLLGAARASGLFDALASAQPPTTRRSKRR
jgi:tetratricopeptide (TPR) repeat protein